MNQRILIVLGLAVGLWSVPGAASVLYLDGVAPADSTLTFGDHLMPSELHGSVAGTAGSAGISNAGDALNGSRTYMYDAGAQPDLTDGVANRGDPGFAMLIWDMASAFDSMRLYTHQDHYGGGSITTPFVAQDVMEYSVWGSQDGDRFVLLSDVTGFDLAGGGAGKPTYTFNGTAPTVVYRGGSAENGVTNAYTREYVFPTAYRYYGIRTSQISLSANDRDPEIDAVAAFNTADRCTTNPSDPSCVVAAPEPGTLVIALLGMLGLGFSAGSRRR